jgi:hypothetical protein
MNSRRPQPSNHETARFKFNKPEARHASLLASACIIPGIDEIRYARTKLYRTNGEQKMIITEREAGSRDYVGEGLEGADEVPVPAHPELVRLHGGWQRRRRRSGATTAASSAPLRTRSSGRGRELAEEVTMMPLRSESGASGIAARRPRRRWGRRSGWEGRIGSLRLSLSLSLSALVKTRPVTASAW